MIRATEMSEQDRKNFDRWTSSAQYWETHRDIIRQMFAPVSEALIDDANIARGDSVLDVATGPGEPALRIAEPRLESCEPSLQRQVLQIPRSACFVSPSMCRCLPRTSGISGWRCPKSSGSVSPRFNQIVGTM